MVLRGFMLAASMASYFAFASSLTALVMLRLHKLLRRTPLHTSSFAYQYETLRSLWLNLPIFALTYALMCLSLLSKKLVSFLAASASLNVPSLRTHFVLKRLYRSVIAPWTGGIRVFFLAGRGTLPLRVSYGVSRDACKGLLLISCC